MAGHHVPVRLTVVVLHGSCPCRLPVRTTLRDVVLPVLLLVLINEFPVPHHVVVVAVGPILLLGVESHDLLLHSDERGVLPSEMPEDDIAGIAEIHCLVRHPVVLLDVVVDDVSESVETAADVGVVVVHACIVPLECHSSRGFGRKKAEKWGGGANIPSLAPIAMLPQVDSSAVLWGVVWVVGVVVAHACIVPLECHSSRGFGRFFRHFFDGACG
jgi:hypothetical protein